MSDRKLLVSGWDGILDAAGSKDNGQGGDRSSWESTCSDSLPS